MNRQEKEQVIQNLRGFFQGNNTSFLVNYRGMSVAQMQQLRKKIRAQSGALNVAKARFMRIAIDDMDTLSDLKPFLKDQIAVVFTDDSPGVAKVLYDFSMEHPLKLVAGITGSHFLNAQAIATIAKLPSREQLLAQFAGLLKAPLVRLAQDMNQLLAGPVRALKQLEGKKRSE